MATQLLHLSTLPPHLSMAAFPGQETPATTNRHLENYRRGLLPLRRAQSSLTTPESKGTVMSSLLETSATQPEI